MMNIEEYKRRCQCTEPSALKGYQLHDSIYKLTHVQCTLKQVKVKVFLVDSIFYHANCCVVHCTE